MYFGYFLPWWAAALLVALAALIGIVTYRRAQPRNSGLPDARPRLARPLLAALRACALLVLLLALFRPLIVVSERDPGGAVVPVLIDQSRSMRVADAGGKRRIDAAVEQVRPLLSRLPARVHPDVFAFGAVVSPTDLDHLSSADQGETDIEGALRAIRGRYQGRSVAGVLVVSDGAETRGLEQPVGTAGSASSNATATVRVFTIGVGGAPPDREVKTVTVGQESLAGSLVDLDAVVSSTALGTTPFDVTLVAHGTSLDPASPGRVVDVRHVAPVDGVPTHVRFPVVPDSAPAVYTVEVPADPREAVAGNNRVAVLVEPPARKRRILFVQGAPGFEHSFLRRAWAADAAVEVDSVVRKGKNDQGQDAFYIQADPARTPALIGGYPTTKAALFGYDAIVFGSVEWDFLTRDQLAMTADFVRERGGGVLVLGARSFASPGLSGSPLEEALPFELAGGRGAVALTASSDEAGGRSQPESARGGDDKLRLTKDGREHAIMRVADAPAESERLWQSLPGLAAVNRVGAARPGATVLAVTASGGVTRPVLGVQRYGRGRAAEFTGEGSWRWKMLMPAPDRTHELFWRQIVRWLSAASPDPVTVAAPDDAQPGATASVEVLAVDGEFRPVADATVNVRVTAPAGEVKSVVATLADPAAGRYSARVKLQGAGVYQAQAEARTGSRVLGSASASFLAGGRDPELADPRLNDGVLQRIAAATNGRYVPLSQAGELVDALSDGAARGQLSPQPRDLWQHPLVFAFVASLLCAEWTLRRRWGFV
jgi:hypothetical protein